jgi:hypothetical protein
MLLIFHCSVNDFFKAMYVTSGGCSPLIFQQRKLKIYLMNGIARTSELTFCCAFFAAMHWSLTSYQHLILCLFYQPMQKSAQINAGHHILSNMQGKKMVMVLVFNLSALLVLFATKVQM